MWERASSGDKVSLLFIQRRRGKSGDFSCHGADHTRSHSTQRATCGQEAHADGGPEEFVTITWPQKTDGWAQLSAAARSLYDFKKAFPTGGKILADSRTNKLPLRIRPVKYEVERRFLHAALKKKTTEEVKEEEATTSGCCCGGSFYQNRIGFSH